MKLSKGMDVTVSCKELCEKVQDGLLYNITIEIQKDESGENAYFDLYNEHNELACMDGETCRIVDIDKNGFVTLKNVDGESEKLFTLSPYEAAIGLFANP